MWSRIVLAWVPIGIVALVGCDPLRSGSSGQPGGTSAPRFPVTRYQLGNGLEVILHEDHTVALDYVSVWYHAGSGDDTDGKSGLAHLCEHMMFEGSAHVKPGEHFQVLRVAGTADGNATTAADRTNYFETVASNQLETALWLESDRMSYLVGALDQARFDNQRDVVRNERRQRYENVAFGAETLAIGQALYPPGHPYRWLTIGTHEDIASETLDDAAAFFRQWYAPSNATLLIAGDIDPTATRTMVEKWFSTLPGAKSRPTHRALTAPRLPASLRQVVNDPFSKLRRIHYVWPSARAGTEEDVALNVLAAILGGSSYGWIWGRLIWETPVAEAVRVYQSGHNDSGEFHISVDLLPGADLATAEGLLQSQLGIAESSLVSARTLREVLASFEVSTVTGYETLAARGEAMQSFNHFRSSPDSFGWYLDTARQMTPEGLRALAARTLGQARVEMITLPGGSP